MADLWEAVTASAVPVFIGGATERLHIFLDPLQSVRDRVKLKRKDLIERLATRHADLLETVQSDIQVSGELLRGLVAAPQGADKDKIGAFTFETFRIFAVCHRLELLSWAIRSGHLTLLCTTILGLVGVTLSFLVPASRFVVLVTGLSIGAVQVLVVLTVYSCARKLDEYEEVA